MEEKKRIQKTIFFVEKPLQEKVFYIAELFYLQARSWANCLSLWKLSQVHEIDAYRYTFEKGHLHREKDLSSFI